MQMEAFNALATYLYDVWKELCHLQAWHVGSAE